MSRRKHDVICLVTPDVVGLCLPSDNNFQPITIFVSIATPYFSTCQVSISICSNTVQNLAARLALNDWRSPIQQIFVKLHWLSIQACIKFEICTLTYKLLFDYLPANLRSLITSYVPPYLLRSSDQWIDSTTNSNTHWSTCFPCLRTNGMELTSSLSIRLSPTLATVKCNLKTFYFAPS